MKIYIKKIYFVFTILLCSLFSCEDFLDVNENPNNPTDSEPEYLLPSSQVVFMTLHHGAYNRTASLWVQQLASSYSQYEEEDTYDVQPSFFSFEVYMTALEDAAMVVQKGVEEEDPNIEGIGRIWQAYMFSVVTDLWGDIPFTDALQGREVIQPKYDEQSEIYPAIIGMIDAGLAKLNEDADSFGSADLIYGGDVQSWVKFANSLKLRMYMRMTNVAPAVAEEGVRSVVGQALITEASENAELAFGTDPQNENPIYQWHADPSRRGDLAASRTIYTLLSQRNDPRLEAYFQRNTPAIPGADADEIIGIPNGLKQNYPAGFSIMNSNLIDDPTRPAPIITAREVYFLRAEAAVRGWSGESAAELYNSGIEAAMNAFGITDESAIANYLARPNVAFPANAGVEAQLNAIWTQKYLALFLQGVEAYSEWRRTGVPAISPARNNITGGEFPLRFLYPQTESERNSNFPGVEQITEPVWWGLNLNN